VRGRGRGRVAVVGALGPVAVVLVGCGGGCWRGVRCGCVGCGGARRWVRRAGCRWAGGGGVPSGSGCASGRVRCVRGRGGGWPGGRWGGWRCGGPRSEEHTSELQSRFDLVCRLLLEKKK